jgi:hypothetical protein
MYVRHFHRRRVQSLFQVEVFWVITPFIVVVGHKLFRGPCFLHLQDTFVGMRMETV